MASNDGTLLDEDGASSDWIEIYNAGDTALDLAGWSLTDDAGELAKWSFPSTTLGANQSLLVFASGKDRALADAELHTNFKLSSGGEYLALVEADGSTVAFDYGPEYPAQFEDISYGVAMSSVSDVEIVLVDDTTLVRTLVPTDGTLGTTWTNPSFDDSNWQGGPGVTAGVGYEGSPTSSTSYSGLINAPLEPLSTGLPSAYARFEFDLTSVSDINGLSLSMQFDDGFVAYLNGVRVASENAPTTPLWNSTATGQTPDSQATDPVDFDLTSHVGELVDGTNVLSFQLLNRTPGSSDLLLIPELTASQSVILDSSELGYFSEPTPGAPNGATAQGFTTEPEFSVPRGFYDSTFDVTITTQTPGASIYYTTNGSAPTELNGILYTGPVAVDTTTTLRALAIRDDFFPSASVTHTYLFAADIINQSASPAGFPADWGTHNNFTSGNTPFVAEADYEIDSDVVGPNDLFGGIYDSRFEEALTSLPTVSLTLDVDDAFDSDTGFYANSLESGRAWERETSVEWWDPESDEQFQLNAGIRAHGGVSRQPWRTPKHGLRLYFRGDYGPGRLNFPLFGDEGVTSFDRLVFRSHYNDSWQAVSSALHTRGQFIQDPFVRNSFAETGNLSVRSRPANVYINGLYWGVYDVTERPDADYFADHLGGDPDDWDVINRRGSVQDGNADGWNDLINLVRTTDLSTAAGYAAVQEKLDVQNLVDYMLVNFYAGVDDWPHNNWVAASNRATDGKFRFYVWDAEISLNQLGSNRTGVDDANSSAELYDRLRTNADFRQLFADRALLHLSDGGALSPEASIARYTELGDQVRAALVAESARWGDVHPSIPLTVDNQWQSEFDSVINNYLPQRTDIFINQLQNANLASNLAAPEFATEAGLVQSGTSVDLINNQSGATLYYTLDGTDPRLPGGAVSASAFSGSGPVTITELTTITMRVFSGGDWSGPVSGSFDIAGTTTVVTRGVAYGGATAAYGSNTIDVSKEAYQFLPGTTTSEANYTNYSSGLNRIVVDLANEETATLSPADFEFRVGNSNDPASWTLVDGSGEVALPTVLSGARNDQTGVQRFTLAWTDQRTVKNQWLQVTVKANASTGLPSDDVFYFGNLVGDVTTGTAAGVSVGVDSADLLAIKESQGVDASAINRFDIDRSGRVNSFDLLDARLTQIAGGELLMLSAPAVQTLVAAPAVSAVPAVFAESVFAEPAVVVETTEELPSVEAPVLPPVAGELLPTTIENIAFSLDAESLVSAAIPLESEGQQEATGETVPQTETSFTPVGEVVNQPKVAELQVSESTIAESTIAESTIAELRVVATPSVNLAPTRMPYFETNQALATGKAAYEFARFAEDDFLKSQSLTATASILPLENRLSASSIGIVDRLFFGQERPGREDTSNEQLDRLFEESPFTARLRRFHFDNLFSS